MNAMILAEHYAKHQTVFAGLPSSFSVSWCHFFADANTLSHSQFVNGNMIQQTRSRPIASGSNADVFVPIVGALLVDTV